MDHKLVLLLLAMLLFLSFQWASGQPFKDLKSRCRNNAFHPSCRGGHKRDVMGRNENYRLAPLEDLSGNDRSRELAAILNSQTSELVRKLIENAENDMETANYVR